MSRPIIVDGGDGRHRAEVFEVPAGIRVYFWERMGTGGGPRRLMGSCEFDAPMHVVLDRVHEIVNQLAPPDKGAVR